MGLIVLKLLLLLSVLKPVKKKKIRRLVKGNIYHMQEFITCDFSPIYNSEGLTLLKKQLKSVIFVQLAVS